MSNEDNDILYTDNQIVRQVHKALKAAGYTRSMRESGIRYKSWMMNTEIALELSQAKYLEIHKRHEMMDKFLKVFWDAAIITESQGITAHVHFGVNR